MQPSTIGEVANTKFDTATWGILGLSDMGQGQKIDSDMGHEAFLKSIYGDMGIS